jgi:hypothetical protein
MDVLVGLQAFASHLSIQHVLVLNLIGWMIKCVLCHRGLGRWTDIIPVILGVCGVVLAYIDHISFEGNFIVYGLANAGLAWLLHRLVKPIPGTVDKLFGARNK